MSTVDWSKAPSWATHALITGPQWDGSKKLENSVEFARRVPGTENYYGGADNIPNSPKFTMGMKAWVVLEARPSIDPTKEKLADSIKENIGIKPVDGPQLTTPEIDGYKSLRSVLNRAYEQAALGKGAERHAGSKPFDEQPMQLIQDLVGEGFALGQAIKKIQESTRMNSDAQVRELLGAINYIAGTIIHIEQGGGS